MVKINGVNAEIVSESQNTKNMTPSINEVLERMDNNFKERQVGVQRTNQNFENKPNGVHNEQSGIFASLFPNFNLASNNSVGSLSANPQGTTQNAGGALDGNLLFSLLPLLLSGKKTNVMSLDSPIFKEIIKRSNNPMLQKIFELMPKFSKKQEVSDQKVSSKEQTKIDSYVKTDEFYNDSQF